VAKIGPILDNCFYSAAPNSDKILTTWHPFDKERHSKTNVFFGLSSLRALFEWFNRRYWVHEGASIFFGTAFCDKRIETDTSILTMLLINGFTVKAYDVEDNFVWREPGGEQVAFLKEKANEV